ncbi:hypothetical protein ABE61_12390 [Lysinibacillus sphaericus]|uniref:hypothetical protein n=1 Tax=Lysinibacillus sphaericus TaxID=1421 RepID=UPI0018CF2244|nr:hypothetical protein [Lysinibacillus sphaericus]MBG9454821.1 hypothetical protein [Lysinibacillus sphaericus]MBG9478249.1 hypothetical protein [Lysinibacillus sphaericus]MBG9590962.1 hypothetical protein [Lysinibacillus sphaericus]
MMEQVQGVIDSYNLYIENITTGVQYIATQLRLDGTEEMFVAIKDFSEGVIWLSQVTELLKPYDIDTQLDITKIEEFLIEINKGLEIKDYIIVADMFEYEIAPFFEELPIIKLQQ